jgi:hypothetical protein
MLNRTISAGLRFTALAVATLVLWAPTIALANTVGGMAGQVEGNEQSVLNLVVSIAFLLGVAASARGLFLLKEASDSQGQTKPIQGFAWMGVGACLAAIPTVMTTSGTTLFGNNTATNLSTSSGLSGGGGLGGMVVTFAQDIAPNVGGLLLHGTSILMGVYFVFRGLMCLRDAAGGGASHSNLRAGDGLMRVFAGAMSFYLPSVVQSGLGTFFNSSAIVALTGASAGATADCMSSSGTDAMTCAANNVATNLVPVFIQASFLFMFIVGAWMLAHSIWRLAEAYQSGNPQLFQFKEGGHGFFVKTGISVLLMNMPFLLNAVENTFGVSDPTINGQGYNGGSSLLTYSVSMSSLAQYGPLLKDCYIILAMFGVLAVWKGVRLWVAYAEGNKETLGAGATHIVAGVILANMKYGCAMAVTTFYGSGSTGICG